MAADLSSSDSIAAKFSAASPSLSASPEKSISEDNVSVGVTKSPWIKPVNGVVEAAPVMGDSWPTITESTRYPVKPSSDSIKPPDASLSVSKGPVKSNLHHKANTNGNPNSSNHNAHPQPVRQRPSKRGGGSGGGSGQSGFSRPPPPSPTPPPFPIPFGLLPPMMDLQVREPPFKGNTWESRPVGGVGSQSNSNDHSSQRHSSRRGNYGSRPRGDGMHYNGHGSRRDQDRNWNAPRNSTARDVHMHQMAPPPPPPPRFMRPGLPGSTPFIPLPHVYGNPMPFEFVRPFLYGPPLPPESLRGVPLIPPQVPPPMVFPLVDPNLPSLLVNQCEAEFVRPFLYGPPFSPESLRGVPLIPPQVPPPMVFPLVDPNLPSLLLVNQIDYYFSDDNLVKDQFLRSKMDDQANFRRACSGNSFTMDLPEEIVHADKAVSPMVCSGKSFTMDLPEDLVADILSRIPIKTIACCNCVCKRWRNILSGPYFANLHLSKSPECLIIYRPNWFVEYAIHNLAELDDSPHPDIHSGPVIYFDLGDEFEDGKWTLCGSVNGLICLLHNDRVHNDGGTCICNPITREYILLPDHNYMMKSSSHPTYGFGFVKASNEYKVVCFYEHDLLSTEGSDKSWCEVYTLGTGTWRSLGQVPFLVYGYNKPSLHASPYTSWYESHDGVFLRGNLHWLVYDLDTNSERVCTFDLEKEVCQLTTPPQVSEKVDSRRLGMLGECLCVCDNMDLSEDNPRLVIWVMKDYGMKECWSKEIVISDQYPGYLYGMVHPLKVFKDGTLLLSLEDNLSFYDAEDETFSDFNMCFSSDFYNKPVAMVFVPSFIRLKSFTSEKVSVFNLINS